jgi:hypothetical protein
LALRAVPRLVVKAKRGRVAVRCRPVQGVPAPTGKLETWGSGSPSSSRREGDKVCTSSAPFANTPHPDPIGRGGSRSVLVVTPRGGRCIWRIPPRRRRARGAARSDWPILPVSSRALVARRPDHRRRTARARSNDRTRAARVHLSLPVPHPKLQIDGDAPSRIRQTDIRPTSRFGLKIWNSAARG